MVTIMVITKSLMTATQETHIHTHNNKGIERSNKIWVNYAKKTFVNERQNVYSFYMVESKSILLIALQQNKTTVKQKIINEYILYGV